MRILNLQEKLGAPSDRYRFHVPVPPSVLVRKPVVKKRGSRWVECRVDVGRRDSYLGGRGWRNARTLYHVRYGLDAYRFANITETQDMLADPMYIQHASLIIAKIMRAVETETYAPADRWVGEPIPEFCQRPEEGSKRPSCGAEPAPVRRSAWTA